VAGKPPGRGETSGGNTKTLSPRNPGLNPGDLLGEFSLDFVDSMIIPELYIVYTLNVLYLSYIYSIHSKRSIPELYI